MTIAEDYAAQTLPMLLETHGAAYAYTPAAGTASTILAIPGKETMDRDEDSHGNQRAMRRLEAVLDVRTQTPLEGDQLTIGTTVWTLTAILQSVGSAARCLFVRPESIERAHPGYRQ